MKTKILFFAVSSFISLNIFAQGTPSTNSVTITPTTNTTDVKGNIKASGLVEANSLKAAGLATGNPFVANPVYANLYGDLVTGYKTGFYSIPAAAFHLNFNVFNSQSLFPYLIFYSGVGMKPFVSNPFYTFLAPLQIPHKSKLSALKLSFAIGGSTAKSITITIIKCSLDGSVLENIVNYTTPTSTNDQTTNVNIPISLIEIDNENYFYTVLLSATSDWDFFTLYGTSIEYRDF